MPTPEHPSSYEEPQDDGSDARHLENILGKIEARRPSSLEYTQEIRDSMRTDAEKLLDAQDLMGDMFYTEQGEPLCQRRSKVDSGKTFWPRKLGGVASRYVEYF